MSDSRYDIVLPAVGGAGSGEISTWYVGTGRRVRSGDPLVAVDIDKAVVDVPAPVDGVLTVAVATGTEVEVGQVLGWIATDGAADGDPP